MFQTSFHRLTTFIPLVFFKILGEKKRAHSLKTEFFYQKQTKQNEK